MTALRHVDDRREVPRGRQRRPGTPGVLSAVLVVALLAGAVPLAGASVATPAAAQQVDQRLRATFARAETMFRTAEPDLAIPSLTAVIDALLSRAQTEPLGSEARALLVRSLAYRADAQLFAGERSAADADLERLLQRYPRVELDGFGLSDAALERFERLRSSLLGTLRFNPVPMSAQLRVDGEPVPEGVTSYQVLAGTHYVEAFAPGYTSFAEEVEVRADRGTEVSFVLERVSAVIELMTHPAGATVVIDGNVVGQTSGSPPPDWTPTPDLARYPPHEFSDVMQIEGLMPGRHEVEILLDGHRTFSAPVDIPDLADFQVGTVVLERNVGMVLLRDLPPDASVWVDGRRTQPEPPSRSADPGSPASNAYRLSLPPGQYRITVSEGDAGVFEETVTVADRRNLAVAVDLRPGMTFLGVAGDDRLGAEALEQSLRRAFGELDFWNFLDRTAEAGTLLQRVGIDADSLRAAGDAQATASIDWERAQTVASRELPGSMFVVAVLDSDDLAAGADLWMWPAAPGPALAERVHVSLADTAQLERMARRMSETVRFTAPWSGIELIDSAVAPYPVVAAVATGSSAEAVGVQPGDLLVSVAGNTVGTAANAKEWLATFPPAANVALGLAGPRGERSVEVRMASTPEVVQPNDPERLYSIVWGTTAATVGRMDAQVPTWLAQLNQAAVLLHAGDWQRAAELLRGIQAPDGAGVGQGMVDYWLAIAAAESGDVATARAAFERVEQQPDARYLRNDGPYLAPMAGARLAALDAARRP